MSLQKVATGIEKWNEADKFSGLCEECVSKSNKEIAALDGIDYCRRHFLEKFKVLKGDK